MKKPKPQPPPDVVRLQNGLADPVDLPPVRVQGFDRLFAKLQEILK